MIAPQYITPEEYLEIERKAACKSEYFNGHIFAMEGASPTHTYIVANVVTAINIQLRGNPCRVFPTDLRVRIPATGLYSYPDVSIAYEEQYADNQRDTLLNPRVIIEVLSPSTEAFDRGDKFAHYRTLESLTDYVLIAQDRPRIEHYARQPDNRWLYTAITEPHETITLASVGCTLLLSEVYDKITFPPLPAPVDAEAENADTQEK